jgi:hypothetical protein
VENPVESGSKGLKIKAFRHCAQKLSAPKNEVFSIN